MFVQSFAQYSKNWLRRTTIKSILTPKIESTLKPSNYDAKPWFLPFTAQKSKCPRRFWEIEPEILHSCLMCPCRAFYERGFYFCFFSAGNVGSLKTQLFQQIQTPQTSGENKQLKRLGRGTLNTCAKLQGLSLKNGVDVGLWRKLGCYAWTSLYLRIRLVYLWTSGLPIQYPQNKTPPDVI